MATVIKSREFERMSRHAFPFSMKDLEEEASLILSNARTQAETILAKVQGEGVRIKREAYEQGLREGREKGVVDGRETGLHEAKEQALADYAAKAGQLTSTFQTVLAEWDKQKKHYLATAEKDLLVLTLEIAKRVIKRIGRFDREAAVENLKDVIHRIGRKSDVQVRVHPSDVAAVELFARELTVAEKDWEHVDILADETVSPGGCKLMLREGQVDATLETQIDHISTLLVREDPDQA